VTYHNKPVNKRTSQITNQKNNKIILQKKWTSSWVWITKNTHKQG
jgi:hypothetical protein